MREFDNLVKYADARNEAGQKVGSDLRPEAVQYLGVSFAEPDWDGDTSPIPINGLQRGDRVLQGPREGEARPRGLPAPGRHLLRLRRSTSEAIAVYKTLLAKWPYYSDAPRVQDRIVHAYEKDRNLVAAAKERELLGRNYTKGSDWYQHNKDNPEAVGGRAAAGRGRAADGGHQRPRRRPGLQDEVAGEQEGHREAGRVQEALRDGRRALREVPGRLPELEAQLRVLGLLRRRALLLRAASRGDRRLQERPRLAAGQPIPGRRRVPDDQGVRGDHRRS